MVQAILLTSAFILATGCSLAMLFDQLFLKRGSVSPLIQELSSESSFFVPPLLLFQNGYTEC